MNYEQLVLVLAQARWGEETVLGDGLLGREAVVGDHTLLMFEDDPTPDGRRRGAIEVYRGDELLHHWVLEDLEADPDPALVGEPEVSHG